MKHTSKTLDTWDKNVYTLICENCGQGHVLYTQKDNNPEYYTKVSKYCECGYYVSFLLPVN